MAYESRKVVRHLRIIRSHQPLLVFFIQVSHVFLTFGFIHINKMMKYLYGDNKALLFNPCSLHFSALHLAGHSIARLLLESAVIFLIKLILD